jgi:hypothetical protein
MLEDRISELCGRKPYKLVRDEAEALYVKLLQRGGYSPAFAKTWAQGRAGVLRSHGWTEKEFYAEMDRRRKGKRNAGRHDADQAPDGGEAE